MKHFSVYIICICLFIYMSFNDVGSSWGCLLSNCTILMNNKLQSMWKEVGIAHSRYYLGLWLEGLRKTTKSFSQDSRSPNRDFNRNLPNKRLEHYTVSGHPRQLGRIISSVSIARINDMWKKEIKIKEKRDRQWGSSWRPGPSRYAGADRIFATFRCVAYLL
jgi:hypothetical protein